MKRIISLLIIAILTISCLCLTVSAEKDVDVSLTLDYEYDNETIKITGKFYDIKLEEGIILADYCINYDESLLKLVEYRTIYPKDWEMYLDNDMVESFFAIGEDNKFHWSVLTTPVGIGCKEDNELGLYLEFKVLDATDTTIELEYYNILTEIIKNGKVTFASGSGNTATIDINFDKPSEPNIEISDVSIPENNEIVIPDNDNDENADSNIVNDNSASEQQPVGNISMPKIDQSSDNNNSNDSSDSSINFIVIPLIVVGVIAVILCVFFIVKTKRGKK